MHPEIFIIAPKNIYNYYVDDLKLLNIKYQIFTAVPWKRNKKVTIRILVK